MKNISFGRRVFCLAEDRKGAEIGIKLAILSALCHSPGVPIVVFRPCPTTEFQQWVSSQPDVHLSADPLPGANDWNCKPQALLSLIEAGCEEVIWLDSDLMLNRDCRYLFDGLAPDVLVTSEEPASQKDQGSECRARGWGFEVGRALPRTMNTSVVRVTRAHIPLLKAWQDLLSDPRYQAWLKAPVDSRPLHVRSDQDVLNALIGSREYAHVPVRLIPSGSAILHCGGALGYGVQERLRTIWFRPTFLHAIAGKPWVLLHPEHFTQGWFGWYRRLLQEVSPYVLEAARYRAQVGEATPWIEPKTALGRLFRITGMRNHALTGLPLTVVATIIEQVRRK